MIFLLLLIVAVAVVCVATRRHLFLQYGIGVVCVVLLYILFVHRI